jgi:UDP-N-acetylglucosamine transferase subunit ALG13
MIFVTAGTIHFPFTRLANWVKELQRENKRKEKIVFQHGYAPITQQLSGIEYFDFIDALQFIEYIKKARLVITHGGPASIYQTLYAEKKPWVLPRENKFREHVNDHQVVFCDVLRQKNLINLVNESTIETILQTGSPSFTQLNSVTQNRSKVIKQLRKIIET